MFRKDPEKIQKLMELYTQNLELSQKDIREKIGIPYKSVKNYKKIALENLLKEGIISQEDFDFAINFDARKRNKPPSIGKKSSENFPFEQGEKVDKSFPEKEQSTLNPSNNNNPKVDYSALSNKLSTLLSYLENFKGGYTMPVEKEEVQGMIQNWWSEEREKLKKDIQGMFQETVNSIPNMLKRIQEEEKRREEERERAERELQERFQKIANKAVEPLKQLICDEQGNCKLATREEVEELKKQGKITEPEDSGGEVDLEAIKEKKDQEFLEEAAKRTYLSSQLLDLILNEPENDKVAVAKRVMNQCKSKEECEKLRDYICKEHPTLCTLVTQKFEERKEVEQKKGHWLESEKREKPKEKVQA